MVSAEVMPDWTAYPRRTTPRKGATLMSSGTNVSSLSLTDR